MDAIGKLLYNLCKETQLLLTKLLHVSDRTILKWERGVCPNKRILGNNLCLPDCNFHLIIFGKFKKIIDRNYCIL